MSRGKHLSLEEARKAGTFGQFAKEHDVQADERFWPLLKAMTTGSPAGAGTSAPAASAGYSGTQTRQDTSEDAAD